MIKKSLYWGLMVSSLYFLWGCSEFKNGQEASTPTAQTEVEDAMTAASEVEALSDEGVANEEVNNNYEDVGNVNPVEQLIEGVPIDVTFPVNTTVSQGYGHLVYDVAVQSKVDNIVVNDIIINRGNNCNINDYMREKYLPAKLKFGRYAQFLTGCDVNYIKEVEIKTSLGNYKFDQLVRR